MKSALPLAGVHHHPIPPTDLDSVFADSPSHLLIAGHANESPSASAPTMYSPVSQLARRAPGLTSSTLAKVTHEVRWKDRVREQSSHMCRSPFSRLPKQDIQVIKRRVVRPAPEGVWVSSSRSIASGWHAYGQRSRSTAHDLSI